MNDDVNNKPVTLEDVATSAGVSRQTASRAINGKAEIRPETRDRVLAAVTELGYRPNLFARGLVTRRSQTVGLIVGDLTNPFFPDVARGVLDKAEDNDLIALVCNLGRHWDTLKPLNALALRGVDGYIVFPAVADQADIERFAATHGPIVVVDAPFTDPAITYVHIDWAHGGRLAAEHLAEIGRSRPCVVGAFPGHASADRVTAFRQRAQELGMSIADDAVLPEEMTIDGGQRAINALLARRKHYDSVFAFNDLMALGALRELTSQGWTVPNDIAIIGCDDILLAATATPSLTSIHLDRYRLGIVAMEHLLRRLQDPTQALPPAVVGVTLSVRQSTGLQNHAGDG